MKRRARSRRATAAPAAPETSPRNGKGDAYLYCRRCRPGAAAPRMREWAKLHGRASSSYDWSRTHAADATRRRCADSNGDWPGPATVSAL